MTDFARILDSEVDGFLRSRSGTVDIGARVVAELETLADDNEAPRRLYRVEGRAHPYAEWLYRAHFRSEDAAQRMAEYGDSGETRIVSYLVEDIGPTIVLPVDVPAEAPAARVTG